MEGLADEAFKRQGEAMSRRYSIDFALIVLTGNLTRYLLVRPLVERDRDVVARWYPIRTWFADDPLRRLPPALRLRVRHLLDSRMLYLRRPAQATVIHAFETYYLYTLLVYLMRRKTVIVVNPDAGLGANTSSRLTGWLTKWAVARTDLFVPWSQWAATLIKHRYPWLADEKLVVLHPGIDLSKWPFRGVKQAGDRFQLLFVGGDLLRKGADTLLEAFEQGLHKTCHLHLVTQSGYLPSDMEERVRGLPEITLHLDLEPGSSELQTLFRESDVFVLPTNWDTSSWVALEALSTGVPVVITSVGGIPEIVIDGETGLIIPPNDPPALIRVVERLRTDPILRSRLITNGRAHVEEHFNAERNTDRLLTMVKSLIDARR